MTRRFTLAAALAVALALPWSAAHAASQEKAQTPTPPQDALINVQVDLTITDDGGTAKPIEKTVSLLLANRSEGRVRSSGLMRAPSMPGVPASFVEVTLNADARVIEIAGDRVLVEITVEYSPNDSAGSNDEGHRQRGNRLNQSVRVVLTSGARTTLAASSDPLGDRRVTLEATATILR